MQTNPGRPMMVHRDWKYPAVFLLIDGARPVFDRLLTNSRGYWQRYRWFFAVVVIAAAGDLLTTMRFMHVEGIEQEANPAFRIVAGVIGPFAGPLLGKVAQLAAIALVVLYARTIALYVFFAATVMYGWAAWYNIWGRDIYTPLLVEWLPFW